VYQQIVRPEILFWHVLGEDEGFLVTFTGQQARLTRPGTPANELADIRQRSWRYPADAEQAAEYLIEEAQLERESYFGVHLFRKSGSRRSANAHATVRSLWLDEDEGEYPEEGPEPTAIVHSSAKRRHLYWRLSRPVSIEWAVEMNRRLAVWAGGDIGKAGAASVLRAAGTANYKRHPHVDLVGGEFSGVEPWEPEVLDQAVPVIPEPPRRAKTEPYDGLEVDLEPYLFGVEVLDEVADGLGTKYAIVCPWIHEHSGGDRSGTRVGQRENGALWFHCDHAHCQGRTWHDFKTVVRQRRFSSTNRPGYTGPSLEVTIHHG
jgi:RepB DNA-primase from phage plasmid